MSRSDANWPRFYKVTAKTTEREIQEAASSFLALDGWRRIRTDLAHLRGMGVQEKGMADDLYIRYMGFTDQTYAKLANPLSQSACEIMWCEWKRRTGKVAAHQHAWHAQERARGALTLIAGIDFLPSVEGFMDWYFQSGLARKVRDQRRKA